MTSDVAARVSLPASRVHGAQIGMETLKRTVNLALLFGQRTTQVNR